jgi:branched-chain amino acid transport system ATP-binding protein
MPTSPAELRKTPVVLSADEIIVGYGGPPVVQGVTVQVGLGEVVTIVGPNGAGKSTLLKAIAGQLQVSSGRVRLGEGDITNFGSHKVSRLGLGWVPQTDDVFAPLTVSENLEMGGYLLPRSELRARIKEVSEVLPAVKGLLDRPASKLSGGERKMVAVARALMNHPDVLLLDEPTSGLSAELSRRLLTEEVRRLAETGTAILLVEQKAISALEISDWGYVLAGGRTAVSCGARELLERPDLGQLYLGRQPASEGRETPVRTQQRSPAHSASGDRPAAT